jgi:hypothetical protein
VSEGAHDWSCPEPDKSNPQPQILFL